MQRPPLSSSAVCSLVALAFGAASTGAAGQAIYVDDDARPGGDGSSWDAAFGDLSDAIDRIDPTTTYSEIRIAQGLYRPGRGSLDRRSTFHIEPPPTLSAVTLAIFGGFAGLGATDPDARDPRAFVSVLSGDLKGDDGPGFEGTGDNAHHVLEVVQRGKGSVLIDGLVIRAGNADESAADPRGGGVLITVQSVDACDPRLNAVTIESCQAAGDGGGFFCDGSAPGVTRCRVMGNSATRGGGLALAGPYLWMRVDDSVIAENEAEMGGGVWTSDGCGARFERTMIVANRALGPGASGGGVALGRGGNFYNCLIAWNVAEGDGGGVVGLFGVVEIWWSTVAFNSCSGSGPALFADATAELRTSILWSNAGHEPVVQAFVRSRARVSYSDVEGGAAAVFSKSGRLTWEDGNIDADPDFADPDGPDGNPATWADNDLDLGAGSPCVDAGPPYERGFDYIDLLERPRFVNGDLDCVIARDIGAMERQVVSPREGPQVVFVNGAAELGGDGLSWATALRDLQSALETPGVREIWMAEGPYAPTATYPGSTGPAWAADCDVTIYGGFAGHESSVEERVIEDHPTVLDAGIISREVEHLLLVGRSRVTLDGLVFTRCGGVDMYDASAIEAESASVTIRNCRLIRNAAQSGLGLYSGGGAAIRARNSDVIIDRSELSENTTGGPSAQGVAVGMHDSTLMLTRSVFRDNTVTEPEENGGSGGAVWASGGELFAADCVFEGNSVTEGGGAVYCDGGVSATNLALEQCDFIGNSARSGGAVFGSVDRASIVACRFFGNRAGAPDGAVAGGAVAISCTGASVIADCHLSGNTADCPTGARAGALQLAGIPYGPVTLANCTVVENSASGAPDASAGGVYAEFGAVSIDNCILWGNNDASGGGQSAQAGGFVDPTLHYSTVQGWSGSLGGIGNDGLDPLLADGRGPDGVAGTADDDPRLSPGSPAIDSADAAALPPDVADLDGDGDTAEPLPLDIFGAARRTDDPGTADRGAGGAPALDRGAAEFQGRSCRPDCDSSGRLDVNDFICFQAAWRARRAYGDFDLNGRFDVNDFVRFHAAWRAACR